MESNATPGIRFPLHPYQVEVGRAIVDSVLRRRGLTFTVEIARQGGKNELSAQLEVLLLTLFMGQGGNLIKCAPTFKPQTLTSIHRLKERLNDAGYSGLWRSEHGHTIRLGKARQLFLSADKASHVVGATAHILLEVDEAQDVLKDKFYKEFRPMGAATNVTTILYGTPWDDATLLEEIKHYNLELQARDGLPRHFSFDWLEVARYNPHYQRYVAAEKERLGDSHPLFLTQYCLQPLHGGGGFLSPQQRAQMVGAHPRLHHPGPSGPGAKDIFVAGVDLAGEGDPQGSHQTGRDATVVTIGRLNFAHPHQWLKTPAVDIVEHYRWTGTPHTALIPQLMDLLKGIWRCKRVVVDSTGMGATIASLLRQALGPSVKPFPFTAPSKSQLGFHLLAAVNAGLVKMYAPDGSPEYQEFWLQMERAKSHFRPNQTMSFYVDPAQGHDDFLISLALLVEAASQSLPREARGRTQEGYLETV